MGPLHSVLMSLTGVVFGAGAIVMVAILVSFIKSATCGSARDVEWWVDLVIESAMGVSVLANLFVCWNILHAVVSR